MTAEKMSPPPLQEAHSQIHYVLVDLSGTLHVGDCPIPGAIEAMDRLVSCTHIKGILFLTNTTTVARQTLYDSLVHQKMGFASCITDMDQIMTSAQAVQHYVTTHNLHPFCLVEDDMLKDLPFAQQQQQVNDDKDDCYYDSVLVGLSPSSFHYDSLNRAFRIILKMKKKKDIKETASTQQQQPQPHRLMCFHRSKHVKSSQDGGELSLGPGGFVACLEHATDYSALVLGKPSTSFFQAAMSKLLLQSSAAHTEKEIDKETMATVLRDNVVMVGDDIVNDIMGARDAGIRHQILVQTGKYQEGDEQKLKSKPFLDDDDDKDQDKNSLVVVPSIVEAVDYILKHNAATGTTTTTTG